MSSRLFSEMSTFCRMIFGHLWCPATCLANCERFVTGFFRNVFPASFLAKSGHFVTPISGHLGCPAACSANCGRLVTGFFWHVCHVLLTFQQNVTFCHTYFWAFVMFCRLLSKLWTFWHRIFFYTFAMSSRLFSEMWTFCHTIFGHLWCPAACSANCGRFVTGSVKKYCWRSQKEKTAWDLRESPFKRHVDCSLSQQSCVFNIKFIHGPLRISCHTWKWAEMGEFFLKMDLLLRWDEMSQPSWTKISGQNVTD